MKINPISERNKGISGFLFLAYLAAAILLIPLLYVPGIADPVQAPRLLALSLITLIPFAYLLIKGTNRSTNTYFLRAHMLRFLFLYLLLLVLSMLLSHNPRAGLFDFARTTLSLLTAVLFAFILVKGPVQIRNVTRLFIIAALVFALIGLIQYFLNVSGRKGEGMYAGLYLVKGLSGHKVAYSILLFLALPFSVYGVTAFKRGWKGLSITAVLLIFLMIFITQTRAVWIGTFVCGLIVSGYLAIYTVRKGSSPIAGNFRHVLYAALLVLFFGVVYFASSPGFRKVIIYQLKGMTDTDRASNLPRLSILDATLSMYCDNPITGVGAGNWKIEIPPYQYDYVYYMTDRKKPEVRFQNWIRPHNDYAWVLSEKGPFGLIAYIAVFVFLLIAGNKAVFSAADSKLAFLAIMVNATIGGYLVLSVFSFPLERIDNQVYLMILMAIILALRHKTINGDQGPEKLYWRVFVVGSVVVSLVIFCYSMVLLKSELDLNRLVTVNKGKEKMKSMEEAVLADAALVPLDAFANPLKYYVGINRLKNDDPDAAISCFHEALSDHPNNINVLYALSKACLKSGDLSGSIKHGNMLLEIFPFHPEGLMNIAMAYFMEGRYDLSLRALLAIKEKDPTVEQAIRRTSMILDRGVSH